MTQRTSNQNFSRIFRKVELQSKFLEILEASSAPRLVKKLIFKLYYLNSIWLQFKSDNKFLPKLTKDIDEFKAAIENEDFKRNRFPKLFYNKLFFAVSIRDIVRTNHQYLKTKDKGEQNLLSRSLALHLYEFIQDFQKLTGKSFRQQLQTIPFPEDVLEQFDSLKLGYRNISARYVQFLAEVRHTAIAHKTKEVKTLVDNIQNLDQLQVREIATMSLLLYGLYDQFHNDIFVHLMKYHKEVAQIPYLPTESFE
jgi:hypothetical protein